MSLSMKSSSSNLENRVSGERRSDKPKGILRIECRQIEDGQNSRCPFRALASVSATTQGLANNLQEWRIVIKCRGCDVV